MLTDAPRGPFLEKPQVVIALREAAEASLLTAERAQARAHDEATSDESKAEGKYDTRATEASYLARGQAERVADLRVLVAWYKRLAPHDTQNKVALGALVTLGDEGDSLLFVAPVGGAQVEIEGQVVKTISLSSPLGTAMKGLEAGDDFKVQSPDGVLEREILAVV